jgi:hypothetical protein
MKSIKVLATIISAIALFPSASFADNVSGNSQEANVSTTTIGNGNVSSVTTNQKIFNFQQAGSRGTKSGCPGPHTGCPGTQGGSPGTNVDGTSQLINAHTTTIGDGNIDIKEINQKYRNRQKTK